MKSSEASKRSRFYQSLYPGELREAEPKTILIGVDSRFVANKAGCVEIASVKGLQGRGLRKALESLGENTGEANDLYVLVPGFGALPELPSQITLGRRLIAPKRIDYLKWRVPREQTLVQMVRDFSSLRDQVKSWLKVDPLVYRTPSGVGAALLRAELWRKGYRDPIVQPDTTLRKWANRGIGGLSVARFERTGLQWGHFTAWDAQACYPQAALRSTLPVKSPWDSIEPGNEDLYEDGIVIAEVEWPEEVKWPIIPLWTPAPEEKLIWPRRSAWITATLSEVSIARALGAKISFLFGSAWGWKRKDGTDALAKVMRNLLEARDRTSLEGNREVFKAIANGAIGKLNQQVEWVDYKKFAKEGGMTETQARRLKNIPGSSIHTGGAFLPEWYLIITARARALALLAANLTDCVYSYADMLILRESYPFTGPPTRPILGIEPLSYRKIGEGDQLLIEGHGQYCLWHGEEISVEAHQGQAGLDSPDKIEEYWKEKLDAHSKSSLG